MPLSSIWLQQTSTKLRWPVLSGIKKNNYMNKGSDESSNNN